MKQLLLRINLPKGKTLYAGQFKELMARACDEIQSVPSSFFHYESGRPISNAQPDIRFVGGRGWVGILSRSGNMDALLPVAGVATRLVSMHIGQPAAMELLEPEYGVESVEYPIRYFFRDVVSKHANRWRGSNEDLVIRHLCEQLRSERDRLFLDLPAINPNEFLRDGKMMRRDHAEAECALIKERLSIEIHGVRSIGMRLETATGPTNNFVRLLSGSLTMLLKTKGVWQFGSLQSRGYGRLIHERGAL